MNQNLIVIVGIFFLSIVSGMLGLGVAFVALPFLGFFLPDLVNQVQPLTLLLNGITALFATIGFALSGFVDWKKAIPLAVVTTISAPIGAYMSHLINPTYIWYIYFISVVYLAYRMFKPAGKSSNTENFQLVLLLAVPISILSGLIGVGPGFLLMPTLIILGFEAKKAAGINAFAVTPPSFSALIPHLKTAQLDLSLLLPLLLVGAIGAFMGARLTSLYLPDKRIKQFFGILMVVVTLYKINTLK